MGPPTDCPPTRRMTISQAAALCGVTREAIRLRIRRGTIAAEKVDGQWWVYLEADQQATSEPTTPDVGNETTHVPPGRSPQHDQEHVPWSVLAGKIRW